MSRHRSLALGFGACLALGVIDLVALNVWLAPAAWPPPLEGSRGPPARAASDSALAVVSPEAATPDAATLMTARAAPDIAAATAASPDATVAATKPDAAASAAPVIPRRVFRARRLYFATASSALSARAVAKLQRLVEELKRHPTLHVKLEGHSDKRGREGFNDQLSAQRAEIVASYLQQRGITKRRITTRGHGATRPLSTEDTPRAWQLNRRVEIRIRKGTGKP